ncbi:sigma-70 family RNA polymerase sigma factor [Luteimonas sp. Y-2-2-4F]|nr:sigma-70 family RNA polymerase sigma factor [Luteimonas sp. Y-2-2-4F]MCD9033410.1 sigma-70 family RNA polymerase sigma factor [Luteimonas sp. Y-2-2-4F]
MSAPAAPLSAERADWLAAQVLPHEAALRAWLGARMGVSVDVDDVVQEAYAVLATLDDVSHIRRPRSYLFATARSLVLQQLRRARIVPIEAVAEVERLGELRDDATPERNAVSGEELRRVDALIRSLPRKCREAFVLRRLDGLPQREIARRMGVSENTVEKHIGKALRLLADALGRDAGPRGRGPAGTEEGNHDDAETAHQRD